MGTREGVGEGCSQASGGEGGGRAPGARTLDRGQQAAHTAGPGGKNDGEVGNRRRKRRKRDKGEGVSPPQGRGRHNRSPTNWRTHPPSCNDKNVNDVTGK